LKSKRVEVQVAPGRLQVRQFLTEFSRWASGRPDILAVALVGSYARDQAAGTSDVDLVIICSRPQAYLRDTRWARRFGEISRQQLENYGKVTSLRVWYADGEEVEYAFADETWCAAPLDEGSTRVVSDGIRILFKRKSILSGLKGRLNSKS
jgi:predicted nucleotidyltransferase